MKIDLLHNKIVKDTMTEEFRRGVNEVLIPLFKEKYGEGLFAVLMYEDYISDDFSKNGRWYYPFTLVVDGATFSEWVSWSISDKKRFKTASPYSYIGKGAPDFALAGSEALDFESRLFGRAIDYRTDLLPVKITAATDNPLLLAGKYSQSFVDELASQITARLSQILGVAGLENSGIELQMVFAPGTYMEHTSENVTYRRLLMTEKSCQARDFWVKWTRKGSAVGFGVKDHVRAEDVVFDLGEDVPQKIREKEFRFLCNSNPDKYQSAMGKKTVTEWRDIIKRALRRGDITKVESEFDVAAHAEEVSEKLAALVGASTSASAPVHAAEQVNDEYFASVMDMARATLEALEERESEAAPLADEPFEMPTAEEPISEPMTEQSADSEEGYFTLPGGDVVENSEQSAQADTAEPPFEIDLSGALDNGSDDDSDENTAFSFPEDFVLDLGEDKAEESEPFELGFVDIPAPTEQSFGELPVDILTDEAPETIEYPTENIDEQTYTLAEDTYSAELEEALRSAAEAEKKLCEAQAAKEKAELDAEILRAELASLKAENERLDQLLRSSEEMRESDARAAEEKYNAVVREREELRYKLEKKDMEEARERDRLAEAARLAIAEQRRKEQEEREKAEMLAREQERLDLETARAAEAARIRAEAEAGRAPIMPQAPTPAPTPAATACAGEDCEDKKATIIFRNSIDRDILVPIKKIINDTLVKHGKQSLPMHMRAYPKDANSIILEVVGMPLSERELLIDMIKAIGNGGIGVTKITLE